MSSKPSSSRRDGTIVARQFIAGDRCAMFQFFVPQGALGDEDGSLGRLFPAMNCRATHGMSLRDNSACAIIQPYFDAYAPKSPFTKGGL
jgi:hypothetical protein